MINRRDFIKRVGLTALSTSVMNINTLNSMTSEFTKTKKMPALFLAHGHPINAVLDNEFTRRLSTISKEIYKPNAIMVVSAHWETNGTFVSTNPSPKTIYDFGRFDDRLFEIKYEPPGSPQTADLVMDLNNSIQEDMHMGLDHGAWTILNFIYPKQDIPVFQLSIDYRKSPYQHFALAKQLIELRKKGVLIVGSGNIVHNLRKVNWRNPNAEPYDWTLEFDTLVKNKLYEKEFDDLINYHEMGTAAKLSIPTNEHYIPMLYILGLMEEGEEVHTLYEAYEYGSLSMRSFKIS